MFPMSLIVQKFGGTSVADTDSLRIVAERIIDCKKNGNDVVVVPSAICLLYTSPSPRD